MIDAVRASLGWFRIRPGRVHRAMGRIKKIIVIRKAPVGFAQSLELFRFSLGEVGTREDELPVAVATQIIKGSDLGQSHLCHETASEIVVVREERQVRLGAHPTPHFRIRIASVEPRALRFLHDSLEQGKTFLSWWRSWHLRSGCSKG